MSFHNWLLTPPLDFLLILMVVALLAWAAKTLSARGKESAGKGEPYACGQEVATGRIQPNYDDFYPFAFFFTIMHVAALMLGTIPAEDVWLAVPFLAIAALAVRILFRKD